MFFSSLFWLVCALLVFWAVGAYHRLARLRASAIQAFAGLDGHLARLLVTLADYDAAQASAGAPAVAARDGLQVAATHCAAALARVRARPLQADAAAALAGALQVLDAAWNTLGYQLPTLAVPEGSMPWAQRWEQHQAHNAQAIAQFGAAVAQYNVAIDQFPAQLLAWLFGFKAARAL